MLLKGRVYEFTADVISVMDNADLPLASGTCDAFRGFMNAGSEVARVARMSQRHHPLSIRVLHAPNEIL